MRCLPTFYPAFHQAYPNVVVEPHELSVHRQQQMITQGNLDIGFQTLSERQRNDSEYIKLGEEEIFSSGAQHSSRCGGTDGCTGSS